MGVEEDKLAKAFEQALKNYFGGRGSSYIPTMRSMSNNSGDNKESQLRYGSDGLASLRDELGHFTKDGTNEVHKILENLKKMSEDTKAVYTVNEKNLAVINAIEAAYERQKNRLTDEEKIRIEGQLRLEKALNAEEKAKMDYNKTVEKHRALEVENNVKYIQLKEKNHLHELELEKTRLDFQEKHLEKTQAIAKKELEIQQTKQEWELKGYRKNGKKHGGAELFNMIGDAIAKRKGNTVERNIAEAVGKVSAKGTNAVNFLSSDKKVTFSDIGNKVAGIADNFGPWGKAIGGIAKLIAAVVEAYDKINVASSKYARSVGGGLAKMEQMKVDAVGVADSINKWGGNAYKFEEIMQHLSELSEKTGRVMDHMSTMDIKSLEDLTRHGITSDVINQYDTFGLSLERIDERVTDIYRTSGKHGLNAKAVTDAVNKNLKMAQQYTFAGGQRALERMAERSVALKYNMESVTRFAEKVSTLEGAAQSAASLSVLGGDFARMGNPLSMLYGGLQDPERLNEMMLNMTKNMAHWDTQNGELRITGENRMRLRAAAEAMGVSYEDLINQSYSQGKRRMIDKDLDRSGKFNDEETREYIRNLAQLDEEGRAYIRFNGENKNTYLDELSEVHKERLKKESEDMEQKDKAKIGDIYMETRTLTDKLNDYIQWFRTLFFNVILDIAGYGKETKTAMVKYNLDAEDAQKVVEKEREYRTTGMGAGAATGAIAGGIIGSIVPVVGTAVGAGIGAIIGGAAGGYGGYKLGDAMWNSDAYAKELASAEKYQKKARGGVIRGRGTSQSDSIPAWLSNGEFVVNEKATSKHLPELQAMNAEGFASGTSIPIRAGKNQYKFGSGVLPPMSPSSVGGGGIQHISIDPLQVSGTLTLNLAGGGSKTINANELFTPENVAILMRKLQESFGFRLDKTEFRAPKFLNGTF